MNKKESNLETWKVAVAVSTIILAFIYGGLWWGLGMFLIVSIALGWKDRHKGPFPTNKQ